MIKLNSILCTKDGQMFGNAVVIEHKEGLICNLIQTDFGNRVYMSDESVKDNFTIRDMEGLPEISHKERTLSQIALLSIPLN